MGFFDSLTSYLLSFAYYYPLFMAYLWIIGGLYYRFNWESSGGRRYDQPPPMDSYPMVSFLVPCHNEGQQVEETIGYLMEHNYPNFEVIAINDGSSDDTGEILDQMQLSYPRLRVVHLTTNQGKAVALNTGAMLANSEYLIGIDGDALLDHNAAKWIIRHFINSPRVGAVTGNPRIRNRTTLLGKIQVGEFSSIIGMIKRAQRIYGRVFTVSGVVTAFRKAALQKVGYWAPDMITEDIDISWKMQLSHFDVRYEPNALCWILMPETLSGLWGQRLRWAQGGMETAVRHFTSMWKWRYRRMWPVFFEYAISVVWSYTVGAIILFWLLGKFVALPPELQVPTIMPGWQGIILGITCLLQFAVSLFIDSRYEKGLIRNMYWMIWYPLAYWMINVLTTVVGVPKAILHKRGQRAIWISPDRGIQQITHETETL